MSGSDRDRGTSDPLDRIGALARSTTPGAGPGVASIRRRSQRRRRRRHAVIAGLSVVVVAVGAVAAIAVPDPSDDVMVGTADVPLPPETVPSLTRSAWQPWSIDGVVDRAGRAAPIYRRAGSGDGLVLVLGPSSPCIDARTCAVERPAVPSEFGFLSEGNPLGEEPAVLIPSWNDDYHVGRATDVEVDGLDSPQQFVGASNVERVVRALVREREHAPDRIVVVGIGGGGIGAMVHADTAGHAFPDARIVVVADGTLVPGRDTVADCLITAAERSWGAAVPGERVGAATIQRNLANGAPTAQFVVVVGDRRRLRSHLPLPGSSCDPSDPASAASHRRAVDAMDEDAPRWRIIGAAPGGRTLLERRLDDPITARVLAVVAAATEEGP